MADKNLQDVAFVENEADLEEKKTQVTGKLQKRDDKRVADIQKRKDEKEQTSATNEKTDFFSLNFYRAKIRVEDNLDNVNTVEKSALPDHFDSLVIDVQTMQKFLSDSTMFLPAYDQQRAHDALSKLNAMIQEKRNELIPKKKFAFKSKKKTSDKKPTDDVDSSKTQKKLNVELTETRFSNLTGQKLSKPEKEIFQSDVALSRLTDCVVELFGNPSTLHMSNLTNCTILCGPVSSSVFVDDCKNCSIVTPCQQLRVHNTTETSFYLHVTSRAIIEDSNNLQFAPYNLEYPGLDEHYTLSGLDRNRNTWDDVDDFNWLASDAHSPNWTLVPADKRKSNWTID